MPAHTSGGSASTRATMPSGCTHAAITNRVSTVQRSMPPRYWNEEYPLVASTIHVSPAMPVTPIRSIEAGVAMNSVSAFWGVPSR